MTDEVRKQLERFSEVDQDTKTWVHPWETYWRMYRFKNNSHRHIEALLRIFNARFCGYSFQRGETHINNNIYPTIIIYKKS